MITLAPLLALSRALRRGWASLEDAGRLLLAPAKHPLAHALCRSRRALALSGTLL